MRVRRERHEGEEDNALPMRLRQREKSRDVRECLEPSREKAGRT